MGSNLPLDTSWNYKLFTYPIIIFIVIFVYWAAVTEIDEVVRGDGRVIPSGQTKIIQHFEGGIINNILVQEGQKVEKGQVLYEIKNEYFRADLEEKKLDLYALNAEEMRLKAQIEEQEKLKFSKFLTKKIPDIVQNQQEIFKTHKKQNAQKIKIAEDKVKQKEYELTEVSTKFENLNIELKLARENIEIIEKLLKKKIISRKEYINELRKKQNLVTQIAENRNRIPIVEEELSEAKTKVEETKSEIKSKLLNELNDVKIKINKLQQKTTANIDRDKRQEIVSPVKGIVNKLYFHTIGGVVKSGDKVVEITPIDDSLMVEAKIKTKDRARVWEGQDVTIEITAYDYSRYGMLEGELIFISPDSFFDKQGESFYVVKIKSENFKFAADKPIIPGMVANINILTGKRTIMEYIIRPMRDISKNSMIEP